MVDHDHDRIKPQGQREISDEINRKLSEGGKDGGFDRGQRGNDGVSIDPVLLAYGTTCNKMFYKGGMAQPPEITFEDNLGVEDTHVARERGGVD